MSNHGKSGTIKAGNGEKPLVAPRDVPDQYDHAKHYRVTLLRKIEVAGRTMKAAHEHILRGDHCEANADNIYRAREADEGEF